MAGRPTTIRVLPVLFCAPVFWTPRFWSDSTHAWDWVQPEMPIDEKPSAELEVSLDATLGEVIDTACDAWGIHLGPEADELGATRLEQFARFAFVVPGRDPRRIAEKDRYEWPDTLPVTRETGQLEQVPGLEVTFRASRVVVPRPDRGRRDKTVRRSGHSAGRVRSCARSCAPYDRGDQGRICRC